MNWVVMLVAMAGPATSGTPAFCMIGAKASVFPLETVPITTGTLSFCISRWTSETARCGLASSS
jgi:hypothetical protein